MRHLTLFVTFCVSLAPSSLSDSVTEAIAGSGEGATQPFEDERRSSSLTRRRRSVFHLFNMMTCATTCNPLNYKGYGCYCGFLGSGAVVDGIDKCCKGHDWCYEHTKCNGFDHYIIPYKWKCNGGSPYCVRSKGREVDGCSHQLCECDREFVECLKQHPCPRSKAMCTSSPWRYMQNVFTGLVSGMGMHRPHSEPQKGQPPPEEGVTTTTTITTTTIKGTS